MFHNRTLDITNLSEDIVIGEFHIVDGDHLAQKHDIHAHLFNFSFKIHYNFTNVGSGPWN